MTKSIAALFAFAGSAPAQAPEFAALNGLERGAWEIAIRGEKEKRRICLGDPKLLLQIEHGTRNCSFYTLDNGPTDIRVSYKCGASGHGTTSLRKETNRLVRINTQGIYNNAPFSEMAEARRVGDC